MPRGVTTTVKEQNVNLSTLHKLLTRHGTPDVLASAHMLIGLPFSEQNLHYRFTGVYMDDLDRIIGIAERVEEREVPCQKQP